LLYQVSPTGNWYWRGVLPDPGGVKFRALATGIGNDNDLDGTVGQGNLQVLGIGSADRLTYLIYQERGSGNWYWRGRLGAWPTGISHTFTEAAHGIHEVGYHYWENMSMFLVGDDGVPYWLYQDYQGNWGGYTWLPEAPPVQLRSLATVDVPGNGFIDPMVFGLGVDDASPYWMVSAYWCYLGCYQQWAWRGPLPNPQGVRFRSLVADWGNDTHVQVVGLGEDGFPYLIWKNNPWEDPNFGDWYWGGLLPDPGVSFSAIAIHQGNNGNLQVIGIGANDGFPYLIYQVSSSGNWYWAGALPNPNQVRFRSVAMESIVEISGLGGYSNNLDVILLGADDGLPYLIWQDGRDGSWHWYGRLPTN